MQFCCRLTHSIVAFFNILACVGWSAVNVIVGAQLLHAVNSDVPGYAGIIIIAAATFVITLFGYKIVHTYEMYSWIPCFIVFLIVLGEFVHSGKFSNIPMSSGNAEAGSVLSFAASVYGFATGWTRYVSISSHILSHRFFPCMYTLSLRSGGSCMRLSQTSHQILEAIRLLTHLSTAMQQITQSINLPMFHVQRRSSGHGSV